MAKDTFYFTHDYNTRSDSKIKLLLKKHGMLGYGLFWAIVEDLYNNANALRTDYDGIAYDLRSDEKVIKSVINDFDLFVIEGDSFGSLSIQDRLGKRYEKSQSAAKSAHARWGKKINDANASGNNANASKNDAIKERKGKERKINQNKLNRKDAGNPAPENPKTDERDFVYHDCIKIYNDFILLKTNLPAKIDGLQGKAMKSIISYFKSIENVKSGQRSVQECVSFIFNNWDRVEPFLKDKLKLSQINSELTNIINQIKNGKATSKNGNTRSDAVENNIRDILSRIKEPDGVELNSNN